MQLTLYGRKDCCLCDEMAGVVAVVAAERGLDVAKVDVDSDPALALAYGDEIPVLCMGARRIVSGRVSARASGDAGASRAVVTGVPTIALDVTGGAASRSEVVKAAAQISTTTSIDCLLVGAEGPIQAVLDELEYNPEQLGVLAVNGEAEPPLAAGLRAVSTGRADAMVSATSAQACITACSRALALVPGVRKPALAAVFPRQTEYPGQDRFALLLDVGASARASAAELVQYALMGAVYARRASKIAAPRIGLLAMAHDTVRHDEVLGAANAALAAHPGLTYVGEVEGHELVRGRVDVIVCEGVVGSVAAGLIDGLTSALVDVARAAGEQRLVWRVGMRLLSEGIERVQALTDYRHYGGAPILGFERVFITCRAGADATALANAIKLAAKAVRDGVPDGIAAALRGPTGA